MTLNTNRKPCIALMGEFSAGKSTLANLLIGQNPLPVQVVATRLPPVRISFGDAAPYCVDHDGQRHPVDLHNVAGIDLDQITHIQIFSTEDLLQHCDLIDMPGISDPNMCSDVWQRMMDQVNGVLWCSHATQAWRQSEAAVWADMPEALYDRSLLLLTRADKLRSQTDRDRVLQRVRKETDGLFRACLPISLLLATQEQADYTVWAQSGAEDFVRHLVELIGVLNGETEEQTGQTAPETGLRLPGFEGPVKGAAERPDRVAPASHVGAAPVGAAPAAAAPVVPRRILRRSAATERPAHGPV